MLANQCENFLAQDSSSSNVILPRTHSAILWSDPIHRNAILSPDTRYWILNPDAKIPFLWFHGPAGGGKTAIAQTIAEMFASVGRLAVSFFFSRIAVNRKDISLFIPTLAY
jgi:replication-associated recombination protein RarA